MPASSNQRQQPPAPDAWSLVACGNSAFMHCCGGGGGGTGGVAAQVVEVGEVSELKVRAFCKSLTGVSTFQVVVEAIVVCVVKPAHHMHATEFGPHASVLSGVRRALNSGW